MAHLDALIATLLRRYSVSEAEMDALRGLQWHEKSYPASTEIIRDRSKPTQSCVLVDGLAARCLWRESGERQIAAVHIPGDFVDLHGFLLRKMDHSVVALTPCKVLFVAHSELEALNVAQPRLGRLLLSLVAIDAAIQRNWILSLGRKPADSRIANLFCELYVRSVVVDRARDLKFAFPITQATLGDVAGLSIVHTNRSVKTLRSLGLIEWTNGTVKISNWNGLRAKGEFDPVYLNLPEAYLDLIRES